MNLDAAMQSNVVASPASLSFNAGAGTVNLTRNLTIANLSASPDTYRITVAPLRTTVAPTLSLASVQIDALRSRTIAVRLTAAGLPPGEYQGFLLVQGTRPGSSMRVPYWYAVKSETPGVLRVLDSAPTGIAGEELQQAIIFRVSDPSGVPLGNLSPTVTSVSNRGQVTNVYPQDVYFPGLYVADVVLGVATGNNVFRIQIGELRAEVTIVGVR
ncbi:MAG: hypothetical protein ABIZ80_04605 [Bryobacteraceae bacterium]